MLKENTVPEGPEIRLAAYSASVIGIYQRHELVEHPFLSKIGPDILNPNLSALDIKKRLLGTRFCNRKLSALYLDQHFIAGIGNYLRTEILFAANVHPDKKTKDLSDPQVTELAKQTLVISQRAYKTKGHTTEAALREALKLSKGDYESVRFMAFNREGLSCRLCASPIVKAVRNGRRIYWCEECAGC